MIDGLDAGSRTWGALDEWAQAELTKARTENDSMSRTDLQTAALRGRIKLLKELISLPLPDKRRNVVPLRPDEDD